MIESELVKDLSRGSSLHHGSTWVRKSDHASMNRTNGTQARTGTRGCQTVGHLDMLYAGLGHDQGVDNVHRE